LPISPVSDAAAVQQEARKHEWPPTVYVTRGRRRRRYTVAAAALSLAGLISWRAASALELGSSSGGGTATGWAPVDWPADGAAAVAVGGGAIHTSGWSQPTPIASLAKVMTALVVLRSRPASAQDPGFSLEITAQDVDDTAERRSDGQSVVPVVAGEELTEWQALQALLLPSANNIAMALARAVSGSNDAFVDEMNAEARRLGMTSTRYTDPSGYDAATVSTAVDQLLLARAAMKIDAFAEIVAEPSAVIPYVGVIRNTDLLLGDDGFVGIKTGSDQAAGGCFMFATRTRHAHGLLYGVVLGQRDGALIGAGLNAARRLADSARAAIGTT
jgi:D-alanyl-D-alanine carboxypeptidase (penicillin-binding protein 5/6)